MAGRSMNFVGWGLLLSYNPFFVHYLMKNGAIGGTRVRIVLVLLLGLVTLFFQIAQLSKNLLRFKVGFTSLCMFSLFVATLLASFLALVRANNTVYFMIDLLPLVEFFIAYFATKLSIDSKGGLVITPKAIRAAGWFIGLMAVTDLASYFYLTYVDVANFGALRAYVNGRIVNRLPDFVIPCIAPFLVYRLIQHSTGILEKLLTVLVLAVTFLSFYRTIYAAFTVTLLALFSLNLFGIKRKHAMHILGSAIVLAGFLVLVLMNSSGSQYQYSQLITERFLSIFVSESALENSKASRLGQFGYFTYILDYFPLGWGLGAIIRADPVAVMFNYFMQLGLLLGLPSLVIFVFLWMVAFMRIVRGIRSAASALAETFYKAMFSISISLVLILNLFPYMTYFPFLFAFGAVLAMLESPVTFVDRNVNKESETAVVRLTPRLPLTRIEPQGP
jgi:hypothetical protein